jgi:ABC-type transport system involved in cytochrome c biogenesis permease subunit
MPEAITASGAVSHAVSSALLVAALALYGASLLVTLSRPGVGVWLLRGGASLHLLATIARGLAIGFFPLTNKLESFSAASLAIALVTVATWRNVRLYAAPLLALACAALVAALRFPHELSYPPPLMRTLWYPLHVPLSFLAYGIWAAAAAAGLVWLRSGESSWLARVDGLALKGFGLWSLSMIFGGFWGVAAWGAYFMWDVKIIWSVILWFHYASFVHLRLAPSLDARPWVRPALALLGFAWVGVAYVGTSFLFGKSSHAF